MRKVRQVTAIERFKPWRRRLQRPLRGEMLVLDELPLAQVCIYEEHMVLTRRVETKFGRQYRSYPVHPLAVAQALGKLPSTTGLLPEGLLGYGLAGGMPYYVFYIPPHQATLPIAASDAKTYERTFRLPPLIWAGHQSDYRIFALNAEGWPTNLELRLCNPPFPNTYENGSICWGNGDRPPAASADTMHQALKIFLMGSRFNDHMTNGKSRKHSGSVLNFWAKLGPDSPYPLDDLVPTHSTLKWLLDGGPWRSGL